MLSNASPKEIRQYMRRQRQHLSPDTYQKSQQKITAKTLAFIQQQQAKNIALYLTFDGEISTQEIIQQLWQLKKNVFLPVLHPFVKGHLLFLAYTPNTQMIVNKFGILEPKLQVQNIIPLNELDIIFTPLVAFDEQNNRLGMGGGFYDRTLQNWQQKSFLPIGLAYSWQKLPSLPVNPWDQPLHQILTD